MTNLSQRLEAFIQEGDRLLSAFSQTDMELVLQSHQRRSVMAHELFSSDMMEQDWSPHAPLLRRIRMQDLEIIRDSKKARARLAEAGVKWHKGRQSAQIYKQYTTRVVSQAD